ncbi:hypothetical protein CLV83_2594 [Marinobacterium mangrovicola]|uniref:Uncharacterized protein n=1 Tax=Marinobacterium mangrovicola TaxID=1476959 RepID=A0A4V2PDL7_9GAMM|nr:hypothetical protein CLV83_2594 [Marinobacterium mangrovicola]
MRISMILLLLAILVYRLDQRVPRKQIHTPVLYCAENEEMRGDSED